MTLQELFGISLPIIQAPMAGVQGSALAIAVSAAGGLGSLPGAMLTEEGLRSELTALATGTSGPYNVNFFCHVPPQPNTEREATWRRILTPYYVEFGVDLESIPAGPSRRPFTHETADVLEEFRPPVVSFHFGLPSDQLLARVRAWGAKVVSSATTLAEARWLEARGVDAIIAQGLEAGGHRGSFLSKDVNVQVGTLALVPQIVREVKVPVIAAGGIADAAGARACRALGACGVQVGTAYLLCPEATTGSLHREALTSDDASVTTLTNLFSGHPARGIVNRLMRELGPMNPNVPEFPLATSALAALRAKAESLGRSDFTPLWAGQNTTGCKEVPAATLTRELVG